MGNVGVTTGPRKTTLELSESPFNNPLWVNTPVTTAPRSDVLNFRGVSKHKREHFLPVRRGFGGGENLARQRAGRQAKAVVGVSAGGPRLPYSPDNSAHLIADERRRRIAAILAKGVLRLRSFAQVPHDSAESGPASKKSSEPGGKALEVSATPSLHATQG